MKKALLFLLAASTLITTTLFVPYSLRVAGSLPNAVDPVFYAWNLAHNVESASHGFKDLLDTNIFYPEGNTLAFSDTLFAQTLFTAPIIALTKNPVLAENLYVLATFPFAAIAMFLLTYYLTDSTPASAVAGLLYAFSYPRLSQIGHITAISSQWLPLFFLYLIKYIREGKLKNLLLMFTWYTLSIASSIYFGVYILPLALISVIAECMRQTKIALVRRMKTALIWMLPAVVMLGILLFPYIRLKAENPNIKRHVTDTLDYSAQLTDYVSVLPTSWLGDIGFPVTTNEHPLYPTITVLILAGLSLWLAAKNSRKSIISFLCIAIAAFLLSFGPYWNKTAIRMPYYYLYKIYPLLESVRVPARFSIFVILGLSVAAGYTLAALFRDTRYRYIGIIILLTFLSEVWQVGTPSVAVPLQNNLPPVYSFIAAIPGNPVIVELPIRIESDGLTMEDQLMREYSHVTEIDTYALEAYRTYFSVFHGKRMINGYSGFYPNVYHDHVRSLRTFPSEESLTILEKEHVRYILIHASEYVSVPFSDVDRYIRESPKLKLVAKFGTDYVYELVTAKL